MKSNFNHKSVQVLHSGNLLWTSPNTIKSTKRLYAVILTTTILTNSYCFAGKSEALAGISPFGLKKMIQTGHSIFSYMKYRIRKVQPKWMSSYIGFQARTMHTNGETAPAVRLWLTDLDGIVSSWFWDSWGFTKEKTDVSFTVFGDNLIHEPIYRYGLQQEPTFGFLFENIQDVIKIVILPFLIRKHP